MSNIKYLFWNIYKKNLCIPIRELLIENGIDIIALVETENLDKEYLIEELYKKGQEWKVAEILPQFNLKLLVKKRVRINVVKEEKHFSCYKIFENEDMFLLYVVHLPSAMYRDEQARSRFAISLSEVMRKIEKETFEEKEYKSIVVGDFNLQPYSVGIAGTDGFNATLSAIKAKKISRVVDGEKRFYYFNPMWKLMGDNKLVQGSYYSDTDQQNLSMFWYSFDEVLIRPYFIDKFRWNSLSVIEKTSNHDFIKSCKVNKDIYSDHLPLIFEIV